MSLNKTLISGAVTMSALLASPGIASAGGLKVTEVQHHTRQPEILGTCRNDFGHCTIESGKTATAGINAEAGISVAEINASLGSSYEQSITVGQACDRYLERGKRLVMHPSGDTVFFEKGGVKGTAFMPTGVECRVVSDW